MQEPGSARAHRLPVVDAFVVPRLIFSVLPLLVLRLRTCSPARHFLARPCVISASCKKLLLRLLDHRCRRHPARPQQTCPQRLQSLQPGNSCDELSEIMQFSGALPLLRFFLTRRPLPGPTRHAKKKKTAVAWSQGSLWPCSAHCAS